MEPAPAAPARCSPASAVRSSRSCCPDHDARGRPRPGARAMMASTPRGQTFSAGVATWQPGTEPGVSRRRRRPGALPRQARRPQPRLRRAVRARRAWSCPKPRIVLQPIVELETARDGRRRGAEPVPGPATRMTVFEQARALGRLAELEAEAIRRGAARRAARACCSRSTSTSARCTAPPVREALAGDLTGLVLEITEHTDSPADRRAARGGPGRDAGLPRPRRARSPSTTGAPATPTWTASSCCSPRSSRSTCPSSTTSSRPGTGRCIGSVLSRGRLRRGARVCAEGIETEEQRERLRQLGVHLGQGFQHRPTRSRCRRRSAPPADAPAG